MTPEQDPVDVVIYEKSTRIVCQIIGRDMRPHDKTGAGRGTGELRVQTGLSAINASYDCKMVEAGKYKEGDVLP